jgi:hypothetical protein
MAQEMPTDCKESMKEPAASQNLHEGPTLGRSTCGIAGS